MKTARAAALLWTADIEEDLVDAGSARVFVPSIMGAGILVSLGILVGDALRRIAPSAGAARRHAATRRRVRRLVAPLADAIGAPAPSLPKARRRLRSRRFYAFLFVGSVTLSLYVAIGSTANYLRDSGPFSGVVWMEALAMSASVFFLAVGVISLAVAVRHPVIPRWTRLVIDYTPLGVLEGQEG